VFQVTFPKLEDELETKVPPALSLFTIIVLDAPNVSVPLNIVELHACLLLFSYVPPFCMVKVPAALMVSA